MSNIYITEPNTEGKVLLHTSFGDLDVELWPKQAPKTTRNFVQLCLEGYYDQTIFHRIIAGFMVQGGDPTGTGNGGESIYGEAFVDEFHSRLRFNHRGLLAMANENKPNSNHSQFFFTLDACAFLDKKHTIFGKVTGNTIFNLLSVGDLETDEQDRPINPPKLLSVEVLWNPFEDIVPRAVKKKETTTDDNAHTKKKRERKATKDLKLLSFGDEEDVFQNEVDNSTKKKKKAKIMMSCHDILDDRMLDTKVDAEVLQRATATTSDTVNEAKKDQARAKLKAAVTTALKKDDLSESRKDDDTNFCIKIAEKTNAGLKKIQKEQEEYIKLRQELRRSKKAIPLELGKAAKKLNEERAAHDMLTPLQQQRQKYLKRMKASSRSTREQETLSKLKIFEQSLVNVNKKKAARAEDEQCEPMKASAESYHGQILEDDEDDNDTNDDKSWMTAKLKFKKHIDDYMTIDPRNENNQLSRDSSWRKHSRNRGRDGDDNHNDHRDKDRFGKQS
ncbi:hypothetical protein PsorP6_009656 [Peronosclerospora sorghi]|uniref:Uncharacterized protein n=1 Tax=Peronosclerospora sorghi TaxID=230839 RepID=A0ACC0VZ46_9STRA|nr:hypothetical protein PsorP6_009656 [Peronosclerospora sorghi]